MAKFKLIFKEPIIIEADSIDDAYNMVDSGEIIRAGSHEETILLDNKNITKRDVYYDALPDYELEEIQE